MTNTYNAGLGRIESAFSTALLRQSAALMPYFTLGYPSIPDSVEIIKAIAPYSDLIELGVPFSDPIADGPTIQQSTQRALENGMTTAKCLEIVELIRASGISVPLLLMGYINPILAYGEASFVQDSAVAGVDGFIVPDLPPEESDSLHGLAKERGLALIQFLAPTSNEDRISLVLKKADGFIYMVSLTGVTGSRDIVGSDLKDYVSAIKGRTGLPVAVGFGISTGAQAAEISNYADGVIIGSALIDAVNREADKPRAAAQMVRSLRRALLS
jgi:tryptophan synthase alpha chain